MGYLCKFWLILGVRRATIPLFTDSLKMRSRSTITMAFTNLTTHTHGHCYVTVHHKNSNYLHFKLSVWSHFCTDVHPKHDFQCLHEKLVAPIRCENESSSFRIAVRVPFIHPLSLVPNQISLPTKPNDSVPTDNMLDARNRSLLNSVADGF